MRLLHLPNSVQGSRKDTVMRRWYNAYPLFLVALFALLVVTFVLQLTIVFCAGSNSTLSPVSVSPVESGSTYASGATNSKHVHTQEFIISNDSSCSCSARIASPSCGCLGFLVNDEPMSPNKGWTIMSGSTKRLAMKVPVPAVAGSRRMEFTLICSNGEDGEVLLKKRLRGEVTVLDGMVVSPSSVSVLTFDLKVPKDEREVIIDRITNGWPEDKIAASVLPELLHDQGFRVAKCQQLGRTTSVGTAPRSLFRSRYKVVLKCDMPDEALFDTSGRFQQRLHISFASEAGKSTESRSIPLVIADGRCLEGPSSVDFGRLVVGNDVRRRVCLKSRDGKSGSPPFL